MFKTQIAITNIDKEFDKAALDLRDQSKQFKKL